MQPDPRVPIMLDPEFRYEIEGLVTNEMLAARLDAMDEKLDAFAAMLNEYRPLLDAAKKRMTPRFGGRRAEG